MLEIVDKSKCSGCHACYNACPKQCISMIADSEGFLYPCIDEAECVGCGLCESVCPIITLKKSNKLEEEITAYGVYSKNEDIRMESSSGGLFTEIATYVIENDGVVFGASFNDDFSVSHKSAKAVDGLAQFRGSKYVQSTVGNAYKEAEECLKSGKLVLFTGTPCQIGGLYSYLRRDYSNLITQDIVCHGVPSPMVWEKYREYQNELNDSQINNVSFRNKSQGWKSYSILIGFENGIEHNKKASNDLYMQCFLRNLCLRPSCYDCNFKSKIRQSDITLADFWGSQSIMPEMDDDKGLSLVLINSPKGQEVLDNISVKLAMKKADINEALKCNPSAVSSVKIPKKRKAFLKYMRKKGFIKTINKFFDGEFIIKLKRIIKRFIGR